jgi:hypothetical protein
VARRPILLFAVLLLGSAVSAVIGHDDEWAWDSVKGVVLGLLALANPSRPQTSRATERARPPPDDLAIIRAVSLSLD